MPARLIDLTGQDFGYLTVICRVKQYSPHGVYWACVCNACGNYTEVQGTHLKNGTTQSCGCLKGNRKHGQNRSDQRTAEYDAWINMKARCTNSNNPRFHDYGERGIMICDEWLNSFEQFFADMGLKPSPVHSLDRINNDGNYEPSNCRWATSIEQANNTRRSCTTQGDV